MEGQVESSGQTCSIDDGAVGVHLQIQLRQARHRHAAEPHADGAGGAGWCAPPAGGGEAVHGGFLRLAQPRAQRGVRTREHERIDRTVPRLPVHLQREPLRQKRLESSGGFALRAALRPSCLYVEPISVEPLRPADRLELSQPVGESDDRTQRRVDGFESAARLEARAGRRPYLVADTHLS